MTEEQKAFRFLCHRLQRNPDTSEECDTISLRAAYRAMIAWSALSEEDRANDE